VGKAKRAHVVLSTWARFALPTLRVFQLIQIGSSPSKSAAAVIAIPTLGYKTAGLPGEASS